MDSFLIVKTSSIGDIIQTFPVLEYLRARFPRARIDWVVEQGCHDLLAAHPLLDHVICIDTKQWKKSLFLSSTWKQMKKSLGELSSFTYDLLFDLQGNIKSAWVTALAKAREKVGFGIGSVSEHPNWMATKTRYEITKAMQTRERYLLLVQSHFKDPLPFHPKGIILNIKEEEKKRLEHVLHLSDRSHRFMVAFGSKWANKQLTEEMLLSFLKRINQKLPAFYIFPFASQEEKAIATRLQAAFPHHSCILGDLSLPLWQAFMARMEAVISMDSAALHLCATTSTPSFSFFGPSSAKIYKPPGERHAFFQGTCPYGQTFETRCPLLRTCKTGACLKQADPEQLAEQFLDFMIIPILENKSCQKDGGGSPVSLQRSLYRE